MATAAEVIGSADAHSGLHALDDVELFNLLCLPCVVKLPDADMQAVYTAALDYCTARRAFLIVDIPASVATPTVMRAWLAQHATLRSRNAAVYFPRLTVKPRRYEQTHAHRRHVRRHRRTVCAH